MTALIDAGIRTGKQLIATDVAPTSFRQSTFDNYKVFLQNKFELREEALEAKRPALDAAKARAATAAAAVGTDTAPQPRPAVAFRSGVRAKFSDIYDKFGYNCRVVSTGTIKRIRMTDFLRRKSLQQAKMYNQVEASDVLSIDFAYKLADNIKVYSGVGKVFTPYKCHFTIQDRNCCTIWHKLAL